MALPTVEVLAMPEVTRRRTGELLRKLFEILMEKPEGMQAKTPLPTRIERFRPTGTAGDRLFRTRTRCTGDHQEPRLARRAR
jgi:hypothetical protein